MQLMLTLPALAALLTAPLVQEPRPITDGEREHTVTDSALRCSALWRSERGLERSARQALEILTAVDAAGTPRAAELAGEGGSPIEVLLAESAGQLGKLGGRRGERVQWDPDFRGTGTPAVAVAPRMNDRVIFGTGLPPATRRLLALAVAGRLAPEPSEETPDWLLAGASALRAQRGLESIGHAGAMAVEPWTSSGLAELQATLSGLERGGAGASGEAGSSKGADERGAQLLQMASAAPRSRELFRGEQPFRQSAAGAARMLMALEREADGGEDLSLADLAARAASRLADMRPRWVVEGGAVAGSPGGWMATATRASDALVLEASPAISGPFRLDATVVIFANDPKFAGQADLVVGDQAGDRILLAINTQKGIYLFRRAGPGEPYEVLAEVNKFEVPPFKELKVQIDYDGEVLQAQVADVKLPPVRLAERSLDGAAGLGAHAGSTVFFKRFKRGPRR